MEARSMQRKLMDLMRSLSKIWRNGTGEREHRGANVSSYASFLGLPAEIRNIIYQYLAADTAMFISCTKQRNPVPTPALLLANWQTHREYRSLMLKQATFLVSVTDYNFSNIIRAFENMDDRDLDLLRMNKRLWLLLYPTRFPSHDDRGRVKAWVAYRKYAEQSPYFGTKGRIPKDLSFRYSIRFYGETPRSHRGDRCSDESQMRIDLARAHLRMVAGLQTAEDDGVDNELEKVHTGFESAVALIEELQGIHPEKRCLAVRDRSAELGPRPAQFV